MARTASPAIFIPRLSIHIPRRLYVATIHTATEVALYVRRSVKVDLFSDEYSPVSHHVSKYGFTQTGWSIEEDPVYDGGIAEATIYKSSHKTLEAA
ncbi:hypothetical protein SEA_PETTERN_76 [Mycobacterium phage PetterN]|uniref:Uncharacterized protein n=1 Tax=Mycobacterium phage Chadwick TaxID=1698366 RepID=A0A0K2CMY4_9CAUD|nr:hypothetical protein AVV06_gp23 [Mycobacterium phage Chadwick]ALA06799.1 hypothetical protein SEA_CHADWICK_72 [Mycobacterium phage Chadwick]QGJ97121.1 hypothetical protein SEA_PETTERN_76 [Mycobacterium phage PetterN]